MGYHTERNRLRAEKRAAWLEQQEAADQAEHERRRESPTPRETLVDQLRDAEDVETLRYLLINAIEMDVL